LVAWATDSRSVIAAAPVIIRHRPDVHRASSTSWRRHRPWSGSALRVIVVACRPGARVRDPSAGVLGPDEHGSGRALLWGSCSTQGLRSVSGSMTSRRRRGLGRRGNLHAAPETPPLSSKFVHYFGRTARGPDPPEHLHPIRQLVTPRPRRTPPAVCPTLGLHHNARSPAMPSNHHLIVTRPGSRLASTADASPNISRLNARVTFLCVDRILHRL